MPNKYNHIEVKVYSSDMYPSKAKQIVEQGVLGVICGGKISDNAKVVFDAAGVWYRENVEPADLESEGFESEGSE